MNGAARPCENSTTDTAILSLDYAFTQGMYLHLNSRESFSAGLCRAKITGTCAKHWLAPGLRRAKTTEICAKEGLCLSAVAFKLALRPLVIASKLAYREPCERHGKTVRKLDPQILPILLSNYAFR